MQRFEIPRWVTTVLVVILGLVVLGGAYAVLSKNRSVKPRSTLPNPPTATATATPAGPIKAVFFGDSLVAGANAGVGNPTFADVASRLLGWTQAPFGFPGSGFTTAGTFTGGHDYVTRVAQLKGYTSQVIVIEGGLNDNHATSAVLRTKIVQFLSTTRGLVPGAQLVLMGPWASSGTPTAPDLRINTLMKTIAKEQHLPYIDPIDEHWITGNYPKTGNAKTFISTDGFYPNAAGHAHFGQLLAADLKRLLPKSLIGSD